MSSRLVGSYVPTLITFVVGILMIAQYVLVNETIKNVASEVLAWSTIVAAFALGTGMINLGRLHLRNIQRREEGVWIPSIILLVSMAAMIISGLPTAVGIETPAYLFLYMKLQMPMDITVKSLLGFFITSAAFRAYRARNIEATLMLIVAICVLFSLIPLGQFLGPVPAWGEWFQTVVMDAGYRTIKIGIMIGTITFGTRTLIGRGGSIAKLLQPEEGVSA